MYAIAAVDQNWGIGRDNALLFHIPADMKRFRALTEGKTVLMGRKTLQSLPNGRGLPHRRNIVLTGDRDFAAENAEIVHFPVEAVFQAGEDAWIIGGESVYRRFLPLCDRVYITKIFADGHADAFFPDLDSDPHWQMDTESEIMEDNGLRYQFVEYVPAAPEEDDLLLSEEEAPQEPPQFAPPADFTRVQWVLTPWHIRTPTSAISRALARPAPMPEQAGHPHTGGSAVLLPRRWEDRTLERPIRELAVGEYACVPGHAGG